MSRLQCLWCTSTGWILAWEGQGNRISHWSPSGNPGASQWGHLEDMVTLGPVQPSLSAAFASWAVWPWSCWLQGMCWQAGMLGESCSRQPSIPLCSLLPCVGWEASARCPGAGTAHQAQPCVEARRAAPVVSEASECTKQETGSEVLWLFIIEVHCFPLPCFLQGEV